MPDATFPLSDLISIDLLPDELNISGLTAGFLDDIKYKNHTVIDESPSGHEATHNLTLVFGKTISFIFPGTDVRLLLNPSENNVVPVSEISLEVHYIWNVIKFINDFHIADVPTDVDTLLAALTNIYDLDVESALQKLVSYYEQAIDTIQVPISAIVDELNRFYELAGTTGELVFSGIPTFDEIKNKLLDAGITLDDVIADFNLGAVISNPASAEEVLGEVIKKGIYKLVEKLNEKYTLTGANKIEYNPVPDFADMAAKLSNIGHNVIDLIKDLVLEGLSNFEDVNNVIFKYLNVDVSDMPSSFAELFIPQVDAKIEDVNLAIEFPRSILVPLDEQGNFKPEPAKARLNFQVGDFIFTTQSGFDFDEVSTCELKRSSIVETGITIEFSDCVIDFHEDTNIPQADADGRPLSFKGIFVEEAVVKLPEIWQVDEDQQTTAVVTGSDLLIGNPGGFTGHLSMKADPAHPGDLLHFILPGLFKVQLDNFDMVFSKNTLDTSTITGTLFIQGLKKAGSGDDAEVDITVTINGDTYTVQATNFDTFELADASVEIIDLVITLNQMGLIPPSKIDGQLTFPLLNDGTSNALVPLSFTGEILENSKKLTVDNVPTLYLFGLELTLDTFDVEFNDTQILNGEVSGVLAFPYFTDPATGDAASISMTFLIKDDGYELNATDIPRIELMGLGIDLDDIETGFDKNGLDEMNVTGELFIPGFKDNSDNDAALPFAFNITEDEYKISCSSIPSIYLYVVEFNLDDFDISFTRSALNDFSFSGNMKLPGFSDEDIGFHISIRDGNYTLGASNIPTLELAGFELTLNDIDISFGSEGISDFSLSGSLLLPYLVNDSGGPAALGLNLDIDTQYCLSVTNIPPLHLAGLELDLNNIDLTFGITGPDQFSIDGKLAFPVADDGNGNPQWIDIKLSADNGDYVISVSSPSIPSLHLGDLEITLTGLAIGFNEDGIIADETAISGTINIPAFNVELEIGITFEENGFAIEAKVPEGADNINVLDIEDLINVQLSRLSIGRKDGKWSFGFGGKIINHISIPGIEKFVPNEVNIHNFDLSETDPPVLDIDLKWPNDFIIEHIGQEASATVPVDMNFGDVMSIRAIQIDVKPGETTEIAALLLGTKFSLGPVVCTIEGMGLGADFTMKDHGNLGPVDVDLRIIYPKGIGIALESDIFTGGGYMFFDPDNNRYAGAIELSFKDQFSFTAIGLLTTVLPDGSKGTSLLVIIAMEFPVPFPLGYNFYLSGVGGILGLHRTANADKLGTGVTTGAISNVLFPTNVISNISQIISDLRELFPPKRDQFLIGPMAMITWSTPPLLTIELGIVIEFSDPVRIFILGLIKTAIPTDEYALIKINVAFVGVIDFSNGMLSFDAGLFDSRIVSFTLEGQMALRLSWGEQPDFAIAVGGFHPAYTPPAHLHFFKMKRLTINFLSGNPRLTLTSYFALTTNSVQFGASIDFYMKVAMFKIVGGFGFDVLFIFDPFHFMAVVSAGLSVKCGGATLFSISLRFTLNGPNPWIASGTASFKILFIKYSAKFSKTIGEEKRITLPDVNVLPLVIKALNDSNNWKGIIPENHFDLITLRKDIDIAEGEVLMAAFGTLTVSQKIVPLGITIERFGNNNPTGDKLFNITEIGINNASGTTSLDTEKVKEDFVPSAYKEMSDADKLSSPSFEKLESGFKAAGTEEPETQWGINRDVEYEVILSDTDRLNENPADSDLTCYGIHQQGLFSLPAELFENFAKGGAVRDSVLSSKNRMRTIINSRKVTLNPEHFVVVKKDNLEVFDIAGFNKGAKTEANEALLNAIGTDRSLKDELIIVPDYKAVLQD